jgi:hypothetical protein
MRRLVLAGAAAAALVLVSVAAAALVPGVFDPGNTGCPVATYANGVLHLEKNCSSDTNAAAGADITGLEGQTFTSASFTLASPDQCQGGSPRFDVVTTNGTFFLGCNNVTPTINADGSATYTFTAATIAAAGNQVPFPTGTIQAVDILIDIEGTADVSNIVVNGVAQVPTQQTSKDQCKNGGWQNFSNPAFKNQGDCVSYFVTGGRNGGNG